MTSLFVESQFSSICYTPATVAVKLLLVYSCHVSSACDSKIINDSEIFDSIRIMKQDNICLVISGSPQFRDANVNTFLEKSKGMGGLILSDRVSQRQSSK